jgi:hypothetical protein
MFFAHSITLSSWYWKRSYFIKFAKNFNIKDKIIDDTFNEINNWLEIIKTYVPKSFLSEDSKSKYIQLAEERHSILIKET